MGVHTGGIRLPYAIGPSMPCGLLSVVDLLEQPGDVWAADLTDQEEVVDRVEGVHGAGPPAPRETAVRKAASESSSVASFLAS